MGSGGGGAQRQLVVFFFLFLSLPNCGFLTDVWKRHLLLSRAFVFQRSKAEPRL